MDIWRWFDGNYVVHCESRELRDRILRWKGAYLRSTYSDGRWDVVVPGDKLDQARKLNAEVNDG